MIIKSGIIETEGKIINLNKRIVCNIKDSEYYKLEGHIIDAHTGVDKEVENSDEVEFEVKFEIPTDEKLITRIEEEFSELYGEKKKITDLGLDDVIMLPYEIENI